MFSSEVSSGTETRVALFAFTVLFGFFLTVDPVGGMFSSCCSSDRFGGSSRSSEARCVVNRSPFLVLDGISILPSLVGGCRLQPTFFDFGPACIQSRHRST